jgi:hypothetical protein
MFRAMNENSLCVDRSGFSTRCRGTTIMFMQYDLGMILKALRATLGARPSNAQTAPSTRSVFRLLRRS